MNNTTRIAAATCLCAVLLALSTPLSAGSMGSSDGYDLEELRSLAASNFDLSGNDAVLLLESRRISVRVEGGLVTRVHRVAWIGTETGIDHYADLRIPWNSSSSSLRVIKLRTWRDGKWWPDESKVSETAVVETTPFALALAADYSTMRETMLLHDGIELPCIVETVYEIEEKDTADRGQDGTWVFPQDDPAVFVELFVEVPAGLQMRFISGNGAPEPVIAGGGYKWIMKNIDRLGPPRISCPTAFAPYVTWSTWKDWRTAGEILQSRFDQSAALDEELADSLAARLAYEPTDAAKGRAVAGLVNEWVRGVDYDPAFWFLSPRPASRVWETAYGHTLDRAVLAAALLREAGLDARLLLRGRREADGEDLPPGFSCFDGIGLLVKGEGFEAFFDPVDCTLGRVKPADCNTIQWSPGASGPPVTGDIPDGPTNPCGFELAVTIEPDGEGGWKGTGSLAAGGIFSPYWEMTGLGSETLDRLGTIVGSTIQGMKAGSYNPERFDEDRVVLGFPVHVGRSEPDDTGLMRLSIGEPEGGIISRIPEDVHLYNEDRKSPVLIPSGMRQSIVIRLKTAGLEIAGLPTDRKIENDTGSFVLQVSEENGWVTIVRELELNGPTKENPFVRCTDWPALRALLLEETDHANTTVMTR